MRRVEIIREQFGLSKIKGKFLSLKLFFIYKMLLKIYTAVLLIVSSASLAQPTDKYLRNKVQVVSVNTDNASVRVELAPDKKNKTEPENHLNYYWYKANNILNTQGGYEGKLLHGKFVSFYLNNNLKEKGKFKRGLKEGEWKSWYQNGKLMETVKWDDGRKDGIHRTFDPQGNIISEAGFKNGQLHGILRSYENGKLLSEKNYQKGEEVTPEQKSPGTDTPGGTKEKKWKQLIPGFLKKKDPEEPKIKAEKKEKFSQKENKRSVKSKEEKKQKGVEQNPAPVQPAKNKTKIKSKS